MNHYALSAIGSACILTYFAIRDKPKNSGCRPQIGDRVIKDDKTYYVFGATGHFLNTCKLLEENCCNKTHQNERLYFVKNSVDIAEAYARMTAKHEKSIPAVAYLGVDWKVNHFFLNFLNVSVLNRNIPDIQFVHIETLDSKME